MDAAAELGSNPVSTRFSLSMEMSRLMRGGTTTAEPVSRDQMLRLERRQGANHFPCSANHESRIGNLIRLIHTLAICCVACTFFVLVLQQCVVVFIRIFRFNVFGQQVVLTLFCEPYKTPWIPLLYETKPFCDPYNMVYT